MNLDYKTALTALIYTLSIYLYFSVSFRNLQVKISMLAVFV